MSTHSLAHQGPGEGGGGNTRNGKPLESYIVKPTSLSAYQKLLQPLIEQIQHRDLYLGDILNWSLDKTWYLVPGPLNTLSQDQIGSAIPSDQAALQDFRAIWIDSDLFSKMTERDQARLLLHEVLMSIKLLRFESAQNQCLSLMEGWEENFKAECYSYPTNLNGKPSSLLPSDYDNIRKTVIALENIDVNSLTRSHVENIFADGNFSYWGYQFERSFELKSVTKEELQALLQVPFLTGSAPTHLYLQSDLYANHPEFRNPGYTPPTPVIWNPTGTCELAPFEFTADSIKGSLTYKPAHAASSKIDFEFPYELNFDYAAEDGTTTFRITNGNIYLAQQIKKTNPNSDTVGDIQRNIEITLNGREVQGVFIYNTVITRIKEGHATVMDMIKEDLQICSTAPVKVLKPIIDDIQRESKRHQR